jgi:zinc transport system permease protein
MSHDTADADTAAADTGRKELRRTVELVGLGLTTLLAVAMLGFVLVDWLRAVSGPVGSVATTVFDGYVGAGGGLDTLLGTRVFESPGTIRIGATGVLIGVVGPLVGAFLVHRQMALIGETLAHTAFAGVAVGVGLAGLTGLSGTREQFLLVAVVVSALAAVGLQRLTERTDSYGDVPIAITLAGSFAVGTLLISIFRDRVAIGIEVESFLFGETSVVTVGGTRLVAVLSVVVVALVVVNYKQFLYITFDEQAARVARLNVSGYNSLLIVMTAVVVVGAMQILGVILVAGLLVIPAAAASQLGRSFRETLVLAVLCGQLAVLAGLFVALVGGLPAGGLIIVAAIVLYLLALVVSDRAAGTISVH